MRRWAVLTGSVLCGGLSISIAIAYARSGDRSLSRIGALLLAVGVVFGALFAATAWWHARARDDETPGLLLIAHTTLFIGFNAAAAFATSCCGLPRSWLHEAALVVATVTCVAAIRGLPKRARDLEGPLTRIVTSAALWLVGALVLSSAALLLAALSRAQTLMEGSDYRPIDGGEFVLTGGATALAAAVLGAVMVLASGRAPHVRSSLIAGTILAGIVVASAIGAAASAREDLQAFGPQVQAAGLSCHRLPLPAAEQPRTAQDLEAARAIAECFRRVSVRPVWDAATLWWYSAMLLGSVGAGAAASGLLAARSSRSSPFSWT